MFIDREDPQAAVASLKKPNSLSEGPFGGDRLGGHQDGHQVGGPFKERPVPARHVAQVPIVPIVIRNAEVISARDSSTLHPGTVDVVVYPPLSLQGLDTGQP